MPHQPTQWMVNTTQTENVLNWGKEVTRDEWISQILYKTVVLATPINSKGLCTSWNLSINSLEKKINKFYCLGFKLTANWLARTYCISPPLLTRNGELYALNPNRFCQLSPPASRSRELINSPTEWIKARAMYLYWWFGHHHLSEQLRNETLFNSALMMVTRECSFSGPTMRKRETRNNESSCGECSLHTLNLGPHDKIN